MGDVSYMVWSGVLQWGRLGMQSCKITDIEQLSDRCAYVELFVSKWHCLGEVS